jgi:uncharacterized membrane protein
LFLAEVAVFAASYAGIVVVLPGISFGIVNIRVADGLRGFIPLMGWSAVVGITVGHFLANMISPVGVLDMLSCLVAFTGQVLIYYLSRVRMWLGFVPHWLLLTSWLSWLIGGFSGMPFHHMFMILAPQLFISDFVLPVIVMRGVSKAYQVLGLRRVRYGGG